MQCCSLRLRFATKIVLSVAKKKGTKTTNPTKNLAILISMQTVEQLFSHKEN
jgi:hypothetical protein